jgi:phage nucleotide-binding protein
MAIRKPAAIIPLEKYDESINILVYGDSGIGKTVLGGTAPNALMLGLESGLISAKRRGSKADAWPIHGWEDMQQAYLWLRDNSDHGYAWIVIDSITDMQEKLLRWILDKAVSDSKGTRDPDIPAIQDHQKWQNTLNRFVNQFNNLPVNVLWTALEMKRENEEAEDIVLPLITGKDYQICQMICGKMHVVGRISKRATGKGDDRKTQRRIQFEYIPPYFAKDRFDCLPRYMPEPTIPKIENLINESGGIQKRQPAAATRTSARRARRTVRGRA